MIPRLLPLALLGLAASLSAAEPATPATVTTKPQLTESTLPDSSTAPSKLPVISASAVMNKFPKECPLRSPAPLKRY